MVLYIVSLIISHILQLFYATTTGKLKTLLKWRVPHFTCSERLQIALLDYVFLLYHMRVLSESWKYLESSKIDKQ